MELNKENFKQIINECVSKNQICKKLNIPNNKGGYKKIDKLLEKFGLEFTSTYRYEHLIKYETINKICPVCDNEFTTKKGSRDEKTTCSHSCSNTFFRSGDKNPNWKFDVYRTTCFLHHEHKCVVCEERLLLDVHHFDGDRNNNNPENLIPLCATHHRYWHSKYKHLIKDIVLNYVENFKRNMG